MIRSWRLIRSLVKLKWRFRPPPRRNVLLYFKTGADVIAPYFEPDEFQILDLRESEVNIAIALKCLWQRDLSAKNYARQFIRAAQPKLILTFIDNFQPFFLLKHEFPGIQTLLIQNGIRSNRGDLFGLLEAKHPTVKYEVDNMFVFGSVVGAKYLEHISGNLIVHGSFKNNLIPKSTALKNTVAYISTYRPNQNLDFIVPESKPDKPIRYGEIISRRANVISWLAKYCGENNQHLTIIGKDENPQREELYYRSLLANFQFDFIAKKSSSTSYQAIDNSEIVVFTSSTLGYESLARGNKTAAIMLDAQVFDAEALRFGWPAKFYDEGSFWTHQLNEKRLYEILDFLRTVKDEDWNQIRSQTIKDVMSFDPGNSKFSAVVKSLRQSWRQQQSNN